MAKVLFTSLGVGPGYTDREELEKREYRIADYVFQNSSDVYTTPFIADALCRHLKIDKIFILGTNKSMWEDVYRFFSRADEDDEKLETYMQIAEKIGEQGAPSTLVEADLHILNEVFDHYLQEIHPGATGGSICKVIQYGKNEKEIQENFQIFMSLQEELQPGDEIYLDITHSFRSIPLFMYLMIDFIQTLRQKENIKVSGIYYGMFEAKDTVTGHVPVVDLSPLFELTRWTKGIYEFTNYGNVELLVQLLDDQELKTTLKNVSNLANLNFIKELRTQVDRLRGLLRDYETTPSSLFYYVKPQIMDFVEFFKGIESDAKFQFRLAEWFYENGRYANSLICLTESMVTQIAYLYRKAGTNIDYKKYNERKTLEKRLLEEEMIYCHDEDYQKAGNLFLEIKKIRHNAAHAGFLTNVDSQKVIRDLNRYLKQVNCLFFSQEMEKKLSLLPKLFPFDSLKHKGNSN